MADRPSVLRETDDAARGLARSILHDARHAAIAVVEPGGEGFPFVSRILLCIDGDGAPVILVSRLSTHTLALLLDQRCSLLTGDIGKGDPLAHPRVTIQCRAEAVETGSPDHVRLRTRFLRHHPKAQLYIDFPDFLFFRLAIVKASFNGGFGRAYALTADDLMIGPDERPDEAERAESE